MVSPEVALQRHLKQLEWELASIPKSIAKARSEGATRRIASNLMQYADCLLQHALATSSNSFECGQRLWASSSSRTITEYIDAVEGKETTYMNEIDLLAIPLLLSDLNLAKAYLDRVLSKTRSGAIFDEYIRALCSLLKGEPYVADVPHRLQGIEKHWANYMHLIEGVTSAGAVRSAAEACRASFERCNNDRRLFNVAGIDPTGALPKRWDCRLAYISSAARAVWNVAIDAQQGAPGDGPRPAGSARA